jgi:hypothetical protein
MENGGKTKMIIEDQNERGNEGRKGERREKDKRRLQRRIREPEEFMSIYQF